MGDIDRRIPEALGLPLLVYSARRAQVPTWNKLAGEDSTRGCPLTSSSAWPHPHPHNISYPCLKHIRYTSHTHTQRIKKNLWMPSTAHVSPREWEVFPFCPRHRSKGGWSVYLQLVVALCSPSSPLCCGHPALPGHNPVNRYLGLGLHF